MTSSACSKCDQYLISCVYEHRHITVLSNCFLYVKNKYKNLVPICVPMVLTKVIYLDTRTRLRVSVMLVLGLIHHPTHSNPILSPR